jgi:hypothetical protein
VRPSNLVRFIRRSEFDFKFDTNNISIIAFSGGLVIVLGLCYLLKTCKYSECIKSRRRQAQYVETECPRADLVSHEVQTVTSEFSPAGQAFASVQETEPEKNGATVQAVQTVESETSQGT